MINELLSQFPYLTSVYEDLGPVRFLGQSVYPNAAGDSPVWRIYREETQADGTVRGLWAVANSSFDGLKWNDRASFFPPPVSVAADSPGYLFRDLTASEPFFSASLPNATGAFSSFHLLWTGFNGTAVVQLQSSNYNQEGAWDDKLDATYEIVHPSSNKVISLNGVATEAYYRVKFTPGTNSAGIISCRTKVKL